MKIQLFTVIVPNGLPQVRIYTKPEDADAWIAENASHYDDNPRYAPATIDVPLSWLEEQAAKARAMFDDLATIIDLTADVPNRI